MAPPAAQTHFLSTVSTRLVGYFIVSVNTQSLDFVSFLSFIKYSLCFLYPLGRVAFKGGYKVGWVGKRDKSWEEVGEE